MAENGEVGIYALAETTVRMHVVMRTGSNLILRLELFNGAHADFAIEPTQALLLSGSLQSAAIQADPELASRI